MVGFLLWYLVLTNLTTSNPITHMVIPFKYLIIFNGRQGRWKNNWKELRNFKFKFKQKYGCYPKCLMIFIAYQVHGWWKNILGTVKSQQYGSNVKKIILKSICHTHLRHSKSHLITLQKANKPPDIFFTHLFFDSAIILIFGGILIHSLSSLLKVNI